jgi:taurine dioxygenase
MIAEVRKEADQKANIGSSWHTDHSYDQVPAMGSILYAREVPSVGGDTLFASMYSAYDALSDGLKKMLSTMNAVHSSRHAFGEAAYVETDLDDLGGRLGNTEAATQDAIHPVVIRHPLSGRPALYVNGDFTVRFDGWAQAESQPLLDYLYARIHLPLSLAQGIDGDLGQSRHASLRAQRLPWRTPPDASHHDRWGCAGSSRGSLKKLPRL